jgi:hypothetical protein
MMKTDGASPAALPTYRAAKVKPSGITGQIFSKKTHQGVGIMPDQKAEPEANHPSAHPCGSPVAVYKLGSFCQNEGRPVCAAGCVSPAPWRLRPMALDRISISRITIASYVLG